MARLITTSLLDAFDWMTVCPPSWRDRAYKDFIDSLNRTKEFAPSAAIQRGIAFEAEICSLLPLNKEVFCEQTKNHTPKVEIFWDKLHGGFQQMKCSRTIEVEGEEYFLYGKQDIAFEDKIYDIKTTGNYKGKSYYLTRNQHPLYIACRRIESFEYIVAEFDDMKKKCVDVFCIDASLCVEDALDRVTSKIQELLSYFETDAEAKKAYLTTFCKA